MRKENNKSLFKNKKKKFRHLDPINFIYQFIPSVINLLLIIICLLLFIVQLLFFIFISDVIIKIIVEGL